MIYNATVACNLVSDIFFSWNHLHHLAFYVVFIISLHFYHKTITYSKNILFKRKVENLITY